MMPVLRAPTRQRGVALITAMIFLVLLTLTAVVAINRGQNDLLLAQGAQRHTEAVNAANDAVNSTASSSTFMDTPTTLADQSVDVNGDGTTDFTVSLAAACVASRTATDLDFTNAEDRKCQITNPSETMGIVGSSSSETASLCSDTIWNVQGKSTNTSGTSSATVDAGFSVRISRTLSSTYCAS